MSNLSSQQAPYPDESLAEYVRRGREHWRMSQKELVRQAGININSLRKIEQGKTRRLSSKTKVGLSRALGIPEDYLDAICRGVPVAEVQSLKICPQCWIPGTEAEVLWLDSRSKFCFLCGTELHDRCDRCQHPIESLKHQFCPICGQPYKREARGD